MDGSIPYIQAMSNFDSVYNASPNLVRPSTMYMPMSSPISSPYRNRPISPSLTSSTPIFNLDLYNPNDYHSESIDYPSPSSSVIIHHYPPPVYSPPPPPPSQSISKLRQINDELSYTLAQCELTNRSQPSPRHHYIHHYPISHETYRSRSPSEQTLPSSSSSSSIEEFEPIKKKHNARITYKAHIPRRQKSLSNLDQVLISTSDAYSYNDPMTIDLYPTRDQGFVKNIRNRPNNQSPWPADVSPIRRNSFSQASTYRTPRAPYYGNKPIQPKSRLASGKEERPRSSSVNFRIRPDSAPIPLRQSDIYFSSTAPTWRPNGSIKRPKFIGSHAPPSKLKPPPHEPPWHPASVANKTKPIRAFDPTSKPRAKTPEPIWQPSSKSVTDKPMKYFEPTSKPPPPKPHESVWRPSSKSSTDKPPKYFEPTIKPELIASINRERAPVLPNKKIKTHKKIPSADRALKRRVAKAESKVKSAWDGTAPIKEPKPPIPRPVKKTTTTTTVPRKIQAKAVPSQSVVPDKKIVPEPLTATDTGRSSLNNIPRKPMFQSTPKNQSIADDDEASVENLFENESQISESSKKQVIPHPPPQIEKTPTKLPNTIIPESGEKTQSVIKNDVLVHGDDADSIRDVDNHTPSPRFEINNNDNEEDALNNHSLQSSPIPPKHKASTPKPGNRDDVSVIDDEDAILPHESDNDDTNENVDRSLVMNKSLDNASEATKNGSKKDNIVSPLASPRTPPKANIKTPPRRKESSPSPPSENLDESSHQSPISSKKNDRELPSTRSPPPPAATDDVDGFFD
ncbi:unnamed protein product [Rotaria sordida]|uniref:Uncharacterized protein n=1 Tax=Rotaria sordida TaxID=392033 RepID=A0A814U9L2_9BILA|nr:unnamed protein product [Rotaria sordida]CAF3663605.1 unnamed protein product [Rotaria sordida]